MILIQVVTLFFFKQKTAYEMRISDWSSDVCSSDLANTPIIAVPTTAGTGSEVTCWATVWDSGAQRKYSLARPALYPEHAVVDPLLMLGKPHQLTVSTGLDALSHALESLWHISANPISAAFAVSAAREILAVLPPLGGGPGSGSLRGRRRRGPEGRGGG